jgi:hypothetical protein
MTTAASESKMSTEQELDVEKGGAAVAAEEEGPKQEEIQYPGWRKLALIMTALYLCMFLVALVGQSLSPQHSNPC